MTKDQVLRLSPLDEVTWTDPNEGELSDTFHLLAIQIKDREASDLVCILTKLDASTIDAYASELS